VDICLTGAGHEDAAACLFVVGGAAAGGGADACLRRVRRQKKAGGRRGRAGWRPLSRPAGCPVSKRVCLCGGVLISFWLGVKLIYGFHFFHVGENVGGYG